MKNRIQLLIAVITLPVLSSNADIPRTSDGKPDFTGTYNVATVTPIERPVALGNTLTLSKERAEQIAAGVAAMKAAGVQNSDPERGAPPAGGDGSGGPAGNVGGYNSFWIDFGDTAFKVNGEYRTSIITDPPNGRYPQMTMAGGMKLAKLFSDVLHENKGDAWWLNQIEPGPYDDPERMTLSDRCLIGFGSTGGPPMLPTLYNNLKRIVQTPDHVLILIEMVHDSRIIRLNSEHADPSVRKWLGDSIGWWEGDTLVVDTTNFKDEPSLYGASRDLHVVEKFKRTDGDTLLYSFTVDDPGAWAAPWSGEYPWPASDEPVYEYACHEGNYAMEGILRGARLLEEETLRAGDPGSE
ncbi:MAG TPA: hypothetical protein QF517_04190 [Pseudomonadales bacterium]|jgi:hypothetical protein|nr:hypothetical protein [Gammaproteobacteria bacterium]MDP6026888.1 hypothetical protein [Pseudomonadales bacterium]MDP6316391.1 hypothetical protein [Pseudomonadales bacterium]MDP7314981.1 hypothetical protein [Pseudomonadales bacterium]MDP7577743.1 hypothetical protein [Pseudomonadales bacterium]|tara:strand:+ start:16066 stop:17124 length:1059 start_codon:yes stop_codon:yes gene_type:complete